MLKYLEAMADDEDKETVARACEGFGRLAKLVGPVSQSPCNAHTHRTGEQTDLQARMRQDIRRFPLRTAVRRHNCPSSSAARRLPLWG